MVAIDRAGTTRRPDARLWGGGAGRGARRRARERARARARGGGRGRRGRKGDLRGLDALRTTIRSERRQLWVFLSRQGSSGRRRGRSRRATDGPARNELAGSPCELLGLSGRVALGTDRARGARAGGRDARRRRGRKRTSPRTRRTRTPFAPRRRAGQTAAPRPSTQALSDRSLPQPRSPAFPLSLPYLLPRSPCSRHSSRCMFPFEARAAPPDGPSTSRGGQRRAKRG